MWYKDRMRSGVVLLGIAIIFFAASCSKDKKPATTPIEVPVLKLMEELLQQRSTPTIENYHTFFGEDDTAEIQWQMKKCAAEGMNNGLRDAACLRRIAAAWLDKTRSPSLYFSWLKTQLPRNPVIREVSRTFIKHNKLEGERIVARLDDTEVVFFAPKFTEEKKKTGLLSVSEINGAPIAALKSQHENTSLLVAMGLPELIRPLTQAELAQMAKNREQQCQRDPQCAAMRQEQTQNAQAHRLRETQIQDFNKKYEQWCGKNKTLCDQEKATRQAFMTYRESLLEECALHFAGCVEKLKQGLTEKNLLATPFCRQYPEECKATWDHRINHFQETKMRCQQNPQDCKDRHFILEQAYMTAVMALREGNK